MKKALISVFLILTIILTLVSCNDTTKDDSPSSSKELEALADAVSDENVPFTSTKTRTVKVILNGEETTVLGSHKTSFDGANWTFVDEVTTLGVKKIDTTYYIKTDSGYTMYQSSDGMKICCNITNEEFEEIGLVMLDLHDMLVDNKSITITKKDNQTVFTRDATIASMGTGKQTIILSKDGKVTYSELDMTLTVPTALGNSDTKTVEKEFFVYQDILTITLPEDWMDDSVIQMDWAQVKALISDTLDM